MDAAAYFAGIETILGALRAIPTNVLILATAIAMLLVAVLLIAWRRAIHRVGSLRSINAARMAELAAARNALELEAVPSPDVETPIDEPLVRIAAAPLAAPTADPLVTTAAEPLVKTAAEPLVAPATEPLVAPPIEAPVAPSVAAPAHQPTPVSGLYGIPARRTFGLKSAPPGAARLGSSGPSGKN